MENVKYKLNKSPLVEMSEIDQQGYFKRIVVISPKHPKANTLVPGKPSRQLIKPKWINGKWEETQ